jgi:hypothetical protein
MPIDFSDSTVTAYSSVYILILADMIDFCH